jgi:hypothetical protein
MSFGEPVWHYATLRTTSIRDYEFDRNIVVPYRSRRPASDRCTLGNFLLDGVKHAGNRSHVSKLQGTPSACTEVNDKKTQLTGSTSRPPRRTPMLARWFVRVCHRAFHNRVCLQRRLGAAPGEEDVKPCCSEEDGGWRRSRSGQEQMGHGDRRARRWRPPDLPRADGRRADRLHRSGAGLGPHRGALSAAEQGLRGCTRSEPPERYYAR